VALAKVTTHTVWTRRVVRRLNPAAFFVGGSLVMNRFQNQFRPVFGAGFDEISSSPDWPTLSLKQRGQRLESGMRALDAKYGGPSRFTPDFDFTRVVERLERRV
jgi:hypothetical protein